MGIWRAAAIDLGAGSGRVVVGELGGSQLVLHPVHRFGNRPVRVGPRLHWNVLSLFEEIVSGLRRARVDQGELSSVGVDTWGVDFGLLDEAGELVGLPCHYRDARTEGLVEQLIERLPRAALFSRTGLPPARINTLFQLLAVSRASPQRLASTKLLLMMPDLMHHWLGGSPASERSIASTSQLLDARTRTWDEALFAELELPHHFLPPLVDSGTDLGPLAPAVRQATGLETARVVAPAAHDTASAVAALPLESERAVFLSSGTWSLMGVVVDQPLLTDAALGFGFANEAGVGGTTRLLKNITGLWLVQECRRAWERVGAVLTYEELVTLASKRGPFGSVVDPDSPELVRPENMPEALAQLCARCGTRVPTTRAEVLRVAFESLACKYRQTLEQLEALTGNRLEPIQIVGGGSQNALLNQLTADVCNRRVVAGPVETTAIGNLLAQAIAAGVIESWEAGRRLVRDTHALVEYLPREPERWQKAYDRFLAAATAAV